MGIKAAALAATLLILSGKLSAQEMTDAGVIRVQYVPADHWGLVGTEQAKALRTDTGQKWVLVNAGADQSEMGFWILHEMAHHLAWDRFGEGIETHGPEFRAACRELVKTRQAYFCAGD